MTKQELVARLRDIEWDDFEVKAAKSELPKNIWETLTGTRPTIESDRTIATITFPLKSAIQRIADADNTDVGVNVGVKLTDTQAKVLNLIKQNPSITHSEIANVISVAVKTVERATKSLRELNFIKRNGSDKTGYWIIQSDDYK